MWLLSGRSHSNAWDDTHQTASRVGHLDYISEQGRIGGCYVVLNSQGIDWAVRFGKCLPHGNPER